MSHPYKSAPDRAFWKRAFSQGWDKTWLTNGTSLINSGEKVASAGSCFAANIVPYLERSGIEYVRRGLLPHLFSETAQDNFNYSKFSAAYGNVYTARQAVQLIARALGRFKPVEDRWECAADTIVDPFRPGLKFPAVSHREFGLLTAQHLADVLEVVQSADVFVFTLGLTEAWMSRVDGAVFPACPGTVAGSFNAANHIFHNFSSVEVARDLIDLVRLLREVNSKLRLVLTVSPVPLVATATDHHVLVANSYSKSALRVAAGEVERDCSNVTYFPAYEIVTGPQSGYDFFENDRREPSRVAINAVMEAFLSKCEIGVRDAKSHVSPGRESFSDKRPVSSEESQQATRISSLVAAAQCEEEAAGM